MSKDLLKQIDDLVASKTFNLDALDGIKTIKDNLQKQITEVEYLSERKAKLETELNQLQQKYDDSLKRISELTLVIKENEATVTLGKKAIFEAEKFQAVAETFKFAMETVFKPSAVRETIQRNVARPVEGHPGGNGYSPSCGFLANGSETETIIKENT